MTPNISRCKEEVVVCKDTQTCLPCDPGSVVAWTITALQQQPTYVFTVLYFLRQRNFTAKALGDYQVSVSLRISTTYVLLIAVVVSTRYTSHRG